MTKATIPTKECTLTESNRLRFPHFKNYYHLQTCSNFCRNMSSLYAKWVRKARLLLTTDCKNTPKDQF